MIFDLAEVERLCRVAGFTCEVDAGRRVARVRVTEQATLIFENDEGGADGMVSFEGTPWHDHDVVEFADRRGHYVEVHPHDFIPLLAEGRLLVLELWQAGALVDRGLVHAEYHDEFRFMKLGEEIRVHRAVPAAR
jgi:hypothetical protein